MGSLKNYLNNGPLLAAALAALLCLWMLSGLLTAEAEQIPQPEHAKGTDELVTVQVRRQQATVRERLVHMQGQTEPGRKATLKSELDGRVIERTLAKGAEVGVDDIILHIDAGSLPQQREQALALIRQRELEYEGSRRLRKQGHLAETQLAERKAQLAAAKAELARIDTALQSTALRAPFAGRLDQIPVQLGDYVRKGDLLATVLDFEPWLVAGHVAEHEAPALVVGGDARIELTSGERLQGHIRYVASEADPRTRTFLVEVEVTSPMQPPVAGMTAGVQMPIDQVAAQLISPALLTLNEAGKLGVRVITDGDRVAFLPVTMIEATAQGIWVTGLPQLADIITVGAGYVSDGDRVNVVLADQNETADSNQAQGLDNIS